jgi:hypothetical protein
MALPVPWFFAPLFFGELQLAIDAQLWLGWACFSIKVPSPWHQGVCFNLPMIFCA